MSTKFCAKQCIYQTLRRECLVRICGKRARLKMHTVINQLCGCPFNWIKRSPRTQIFIEWRKLFEKYNIFIQELPPPRPTQFFGVGTQCGKHERRALRHWMHHIFVVVWMRRTNIASLDALFSCALLPLYEVQNANLYQISFISTKLFRLTCAKQCVNQALRPVPEHRTAAVHVEACENRKT